MSTIVVSKMAGGQPAGYGPECEILHHACLRRSLSREDGEQPFFVRFRHSGRFLSHVTPDASLRVEGNTCLVRIFAMSASDALATLEHHYGRSIDRSCPITTEARTPLSIINGHPHRIVVWPEAA